MYRSIGTGAQPWRWRWKHKHCGWSVDCSLLMVLENKQRRGRSTAIMKKQNLANLWFRDVTPVKRGKRGDADVGEAMLQATFIGFWLKLWGNLRCIRATLAVPLQHASVCIPEWLNDKVYPSGTSLESIGMMLEAGGSSNCVAS